MKSYEFPFLATIQVNPLANQPASSRAQSSELKTLIDTGLTLNITEAQIITIVLVSTMATYIATKTRYLGIFSWLGFSIMGLVGLASSGWNIWLLVEHFTTPKHFINALDVCNMTSLCQLNALI